MPSKNIVKEYVADTYYHVFNRGVAKQDIFKEKEDYVVFLNLLKRYLAKEMQKAHLVESIPAIDIKLT